ncbi:MAG: hypothetical protein R2881_04500 [Eubacteriales bacterium]
MKKPIGLTSITLNKTKPTAKQEDKTVANQIMKNIDLASRSRFLHW